MNDFQGSPVTAALAEENHSRGAATPASPLPGSSRPVLIIGVPRSGTSWLGKIFDSHPRVIYRHEPDYVIRREEFPGLCAVEEIPRYADAARRYVAKLMTVRQMKSSGTRPVFAKPFQPFPALHIRRAMAVGLRAGASFPAAYTWLGRVPIPDFVSGNADAAAITYVLKSVDLLGAAALLARALPESRIIAVFRHPCGHIASAKRALAAGMTSHELYGTAVLATPRARELGLTRERYEAMPMLDRRVWAWALVHAKLFDEARDLPNLRILQYERLCEAPIEQARELMVFARLPWVDETARFIERSTRSSGRERYYSLFRDPMEAATKWRRELSSAEIAHFTGIVERVLPGLLSD